MEKLVLTLFVGVLGGCVFLGLPILLALGIGLLLFIWYSLHKGYAMQSVLRMCLEGVCTVKNILITFIFIGMLTGIWRAAGTIPSIVCLFIGCMTPALFVLMTFLLNALLSVLTGTAFGTAATMGAICMTMGHALGINPVISGGAVLSGVFFGDRCSPVSTSALLVAELTKTNIFTNIGLMIKSSAVPTLLTCLIYFLLGWFMRPELGTTIDVHELFSREFALGLLPLIPAVILLLLALFRVSVKTTMAASILSAVPVCLFYQHQDFLSILRVVTFGFTTDDEQLARMIAGGGITSMLKVSAIVCLASSYSGIFAKTGLLEFITKRLKELSEKWHAFAIILPSSFIAGMVACNQTLAIILTHQLCASTEPDRQRLAILLEDSAVVTSALIPWSIASSVPLTSAGAPEAGILAACYLYILPLWCLLVETRRHGQTSGR